MTPLNDPSSDQRPCVLIIDDEESVRMALRAILQGEYQVLDADSAPRGLDLMKSHRADLVTLDVLMPGKSGLEMLRALRESETHKDVPVIMITGHASLESACEALRLGATDYLQKPFQIEDLKKSVRQGLRRNEPLDLGLPSPSVAPSEPDAEVLGEDERKLMQLGKASAAFVHDLASPLQVISILNSLCTQRMAEEPAGPDRDCQLREVLGQMDRLLSWASELAKGWQSIAVPIKQNCECLEAGQLLKSITALVEPFAHLNSVKLNCPVATERIDLEGDRVQIERALVNLALNGIKASSSRGHTIEISARKFRDSVVFRFADSGHGFAPERMKEVLGTNPFAGAARKRQGLGLFIADWIAVNHGGKLQFISELGQGTTVELFLPVKK